MANKGLSSRDLEENTRGSLTQRHPDRVGVNDVHREDEKRVEGWGKQALPCSKVREKRSLASDYTGGSTPNIRRGILLELKESK